MSRQIRRRGCHQRRSAARRRYVQGLFEWSGGQFLGGCVRRTLVE